MRRGTIRRPCPECGRLVGADYWGKVYWHAARTAPFPAGRTHKPPACSAVGKSFSGPTYNYGAQ